ncbi:MAG: beta strand repeat-containing protein [Lentimicrobium sp.]
MKSQLNTREEIMTISIKKMAVVLFAIHTAVSVPLYAQFAGGSGSSTDPYQIESHEHLNAVRNYLNNVNVYFIMLNDIDLSAACAPGGDYYNSGEGWIPIGSATSSAFRGGFNGNGYKIIGLFINRSALHQGLFGYTYGSLISNLGIENANITGSTNCGGLVAVNFNSSSIINNCYIVGSVYGTSITGNIGGLVGENDGSIVNCFSNGIVSGGSYIGGLVGQNDGSVVDSYSSANVTGGSSLDAGGLVGYLTGSISNSYGTGSVIGGGNAGGMVGRAWTNSTISNSYCTGMASSNGANVGGFAGRIFGNSNISNSYSRGNVVRSGGSNTNFGGFCGLNDNSKVINCYSTGSVKTSAGANIEGKGFAGNIVIGDNFLMSGNYYDFIASGQTSALGATGKSTTQMMQQATFTGWDFTNIWGIDENADYPTLQQLYFPPAPRNLSATAGNVVVYLNWNSPLGATPDGYKIYRSGVLLNTIPIETIYFTDNDVVNGMTYSYYVTAVYTSGESLPSNTVNVVLFNGGTGTFSDPYQINTHQQLNSVRNYLNNLNVYFIMLNDIDLAEACTPGGDYYNFGQGWIPIGSASSSAFRGRFNGNGHIINGLYINRSALHQGLFGYTYGSLISNLGIENANITGSTNCGGLVAVNFNSSSIINNCYIVGSVYGTLITGNIGGLVGENDGSIVNCFSNGIVSGGSYIGGLVGQNDGSVVDSYSSANVTGGSSLDAGGLVGYLTGSISNSYGTGSVIGGGNAGGMVGRAWTNSTISNSYCTGMVSSNGTNVGGFAGRIFGNSNISNSYSRGNVVRSGGSNTNFGGFCGLNDNSKVINCYSTGSVKTSAGANIEGKGFAGNIITGDNFLMSGNYYDMTVSGQTSAIGATGKSTDEMTFPYAPNTYTGWDFTDIWVEDVNSIMNNGYPYLFWQPIVVITVPAVSTVSITEITHNTATSGGNVTADGGAPVSVRGVVWSTAPNPTVQLNNGMTTNGTGTGAFTGNLSGLSPETTYYVRAYATNSEGTGYGEELSFATLTFSGPLEPEGTGTSEDPYQIANLNNLYWLFESETAWDNDFIQTGNIGATRTSLKNTDNGWIPIGNETTPFTGSYDGNGFTIDGLFINQPGAYYYLGLFGNVSGATIANLGVINVDITGGYCVGALVGSSSFSNINNCFSSGNLTGNDWIGSLVGTIYYSSLSNCFSTANIEGVNYVGGLVGVNEGISTISNSYSKGSVTGISYIGGLVGTANLSSIESCYSTGPVNGSSETGGLVGFADNSTVFDSYWNIVTSGQTSSSGGNARTTAEMTYPYATNTYTGWDFTDTWVEDLNFNTNNGYPYLLWQTIGGITLPQVSTAPVTGITTSSAISGGDVSSDGGNAVTAKGIAWCSASSIFSGISPEFISACPLSSEAINGSNNNDNQLTPGNIVLYKTNGNRFGKFIITSYGINLELAWITYNSDGSVYSSGEDLVIHASYLADLDIGQETSDYSLADFWWSLQDETIRFLYPENGALFGVYHLAGDNLSLYINEGYTTEGDDTGSFTSGIPGLSEETAYYVRAYAINSAGIAYGTPLKFITASSESSIINLTVFIEGLYDPGSQSMRKAMAENGPRFPWEVAEQITVSLAESFAPYNVIAGSGLINLNSDGNCTAYFPVSVSGDYYLIVTHRNSLETWSSAPVSFTDNPVSYDFSDAASKTYGNNAVLIGTKYCIYGGDVNQDGIVDTGDMTPVDNDVSDYLSGYLPTDVNGDGIVDTGDITIVDNNAGNYIGEINP